MNIFLLSATDDLDQSLRESLKNEIAKRGNNVAYLSLKPQTGDRPYPETTSEASKHAKGSVEEPFVLRSFCYLYISSYRR